MTSGAIGGLSLATAILAIGLIPFARRWQPSAPAHPDRAALLDAGLRISLGRWEAVRGIAILCGVIVGSAAGSSIVGALLLAVAPSMIARVRAGAARDRARLALAPLLAATHAGLRSGLALPEALRRSVAGCTDAIARRPFEEALARFDLGDPLDAALASAARGSRDQRVSDALQTLALGVSERMPIDRAAALLDAVAELVRHDEGVENDVRARTAGIRLQLYLLAGVVPILSVYLLATLPGLAATLGSALGRTVLVPGAAALEVAGILLSRRIVRSVLT